MCKTCLTKITQFNILFYLSVHIRKYFSEMTKTFIIKIALTVIIFLINGCGEIVSYPDNPIVKFKGFTLFRSVDILGNNILLGKLEIEFTDGDGDIGIQQPNLPDIPDSLKYNLFLSLHQIKNAQEVKIEGPEGELNYRVPYIERTGQNKTLKGTIYVDIEYKTLEYDTIFYTFQLLDRSFKRSNTDTTALIVFTGIDL